MLGSKRLVFRLTIAGALSFILGATISVVAFIPIPNNLYPTVYIGDLILLYIIRILPGILSGALLGAAWGFLVTNMYKANKARG